MFLRLLCILLSSPCSTHPLQHPLLARMSANYALMPKYTHQWGYSSNIIYPTRIMLQLGIDVFKSEVWTPEIVQTIYWRLDNNANMSISIPTFDMPDGRTVTGKKITTWSLNPKYLFFNHSCLANVGWRGCAVPDTKSFGIDYLSNGKGFEKVSSSSVICEARKDVKAGEELTISYVGDAEKCEENADGEDIEKIGRDAKRVWLSKWFDDGCGCALCNKENEAAKSKWAETQIEDKGEVTEQNSANDVRED